MLPEWLRRRVRDALAGSRLLSADLRRKLRHTFLGRDATFEALYLENFLCAFPAGELPLRDSLPPPAAVYAPYLEYFRRPADARLLDRLLYADQKSYLAELLMKQDQMSMATSIESRVPFLDHPFVEFAARLPEKMKIRNGEGKYILKKAVEDLLPLEIVYRRKM